MAISFATDIKPMFRGIDVSHMRNFGVNLDNYACMSNPSGNHANAPAVEDRLRGQSMPPDGPFWTPEQPVLYAQSRRRRISTIEKSRFSS